MYVTSETAYYTDANYNYTAESTPAAQSKAGGDAISNKAPVYDWRETHVAENITGTAECNIGVFIDNMNS